MQLPRALIIDDIQTNIDVLAVLLKKEGVQYASVNSLRHLTTMLERQDPIDIIFLDLEFPNGDGFQLLEQLKAYPQLQGVPVVAYTVHTSKLDEARRAGFHSFLGKPLNIQRFPGQLQRIFANQSVWEV